MTLPNHLVGGFVFTGVFAGIAGINILEAPSLIITTLVGATLADVDLPHSLWGRVFGPLSKLINRHFGHRTITHSLLFTGFLWLIVKITCRITGTEAPYPAIFLLAYLSHLIYDMMTLEGCPIFYPYRKNPCVIPADPAMRLRGNNPRSEMAVFGFFVVCGLTLQPLMSQGFWTSYNVLFGTIQHLQSEFEKSEDLLLATYRYREASEEYTGSGYVIEATGKSATLWNERTGWEYLDDSPASSRTILEVIPAHTGKKFRLERQSFVSLTPDSLQELLNASVVYQIDIKGNEPFMAFYEANQTRNEVKTRELQLSMLKSLSFQELADPNQPPPAPTVQYRESARIRTLQSKLRQLERKAREYQHADQEYQSSLAQLEKDLASTTDIYLKTNLQAQLKELRKAPPKPVDLETEQQEIITQISELRQQDQLDFQTRKLEAEAKWSNNAPTPLPLRFTGIITQVIFLPD